MFKMTISKAGDTTKTIEVGAGVICVSEQVGSKGIDTAIETSLDRVETLALATALKESAPKK